MSDLDVLLDSEVRIFLLYATKEEAREILTYTQKLGITGKNYVWIATQAVIGHRTDAPAEFPIGMLGMIFNKMLELRKMKCLFSSIILLTSLLFFSPIQANAALKVAIDYPSADDIT